MSISNFAQDPRKYNTIPNAFVHHRPDGVKVALPRLLPDDPGMDNSREDARREKLAREGSQALLEALRAVRG